MKVHLGIREFHIVTYLPTPHHIWFAPACGNGAFYLKNTSLDPKKVTCARCLKKKPKKWKRK